MVTLTAVDRAQCHVFLAWVCNQRAWSKNTDLKALNCIGRHQNSMPQSQASFLIAPLAFLRLAEFRGLPPAVIPDGAHWQEFLRLGKVFAGSVVRSWSTTRLSLNGKVWLPFDAYRLLCPWETVEHHLKAFWEKQSKPEDIVPLEVTDIAPQPAQSASDEVMISDAGDADFAVAVVSPTNTPVKQEVKPKGPPMRKPVAIVPPRTRRRKVQSSTTTDTKHIVERLYSRKRPVDQDVQSAKRSKPVGSSEKSELKVEDLTADTVDSVTLVTRYESGRVEEMTCWTRQPTSELTEICKAKDKLTEENMRLKQLLAKDWNV